MTPNDMKSGDKFINNGVVYTLQKLPDFNLWILIGEPKDNNGVVIPCHWKGIDEYSVNAMGAFGGCYDKFEIV